MRTTARRARKDDRLRTTEGWHCQGSLAFAIPAPLSSAHGLTLPQFAVLEALLSKGSLTVGEIKEAVLSSNGTIPVVIGNLQKMGLVERAQDPADHRRSIVSLTKEGRALIERIAPENERMFRGKFGVWTKDEKKRARAIAGRVPEADAQRARRMKGTHMLRNSRSMRENCVLSQARTRLIRESWASTRRSISTAFTWSRTER